MSGFFPGGSRKQRLLGTETLDQYLAEDCAVRFIDAFVDSPDWGFSASPTPILPTRDDRPIGLATR